MAAQALKHFAEHGYVIVEDAISPATVAELNRIVDLRLEHELGGHQAVHSSTGFEKYDFSDGQPFLRSALQPTLVRLPAGAAVDPSPTEREYTEPLGWSAHLAEQGGARSLAALRDLIDLPAVAPILAALLGDPRWGHAAPDTPVARRAHYRLDHDYLHYKGPFRPAADGENGSVGDGSLHGGLASIHVTCVYELIDVDPRVGGFACLPGSHRPDYSWPAQYPPGSSEEWRAPVSGEWPEDLGVRRIGAKAGSCLLFSEKLKHATVPWTGTESERRTIFFKYVPFGLHHNDFGYDTSDSGLTASQRQRLAFPDHWLSLDKSARAKQAERLRHGPDQWHDSGSGGSSDSSGSALPARL